MEGTPLLPRPEGMLIDQIQLTETGLLIAVIATHPTSHCPLCTDAARMTIRLCQALQSIVLATCGKGGARFAARLGLQTSRHTILRRIMDLPDISAGSVVYLGIDDFAFRRGYRFGTILVNLESHRVVDLLPDRLAETASRWMRQQPEVMVVSRDRGREYASAVAKGTPQAIQCADRFHIVKNLAEATQLLFARCQAGILAPLKTEEPHQDEQRKPVISIEEWRPPEPARAREGTAGSPSWTSRARNVDEGDCGAAWDGRSNSSILA